MDSEARKKMSESYMGEGNPFYGKKHTEEWKRRNSEIFKGRKMPPVSEESRQKMSEAHKNVIPWNKGKPHSEETKMKIGEANRGKNRSEEAKLKMSETRRGHGRPHTEETKQKMRGKGHPNWKGGITPITEAIRHSEKYIQWRQDIFIRDNFTCQRCGVKGGKLQAHHKKQFMKLIDEAIKYLPLLPLFQAAMIYTPLWDIGNGVALCNKCHTRIKKIRR